MIQFDEVKLKSENSEYVQLVFHGFANEDQKEKGNGNVKNSK
ncbi:MAG: hypothetical protein PUB43_02060 [Oscillospiraceae bacterium]|nr:hypothetical protein [Oscillospiraceae bacterium]